MSFQYVIYGIGLTIIYYIGLFIYAKKRKTIKFNANEDLNDNSLIGESTLAFSDNNYKSSLTHSNETTNKTTSVQTINDTVSYKTQAEPKDKINTTDENIISKTDDSLALNIPVDIFDTNTKVDQVPDDNNQQELSIENIHESESADFMLSAYKNSIEKTHNVSMSQLLDVIASPEFDNNLPDGEVNTIDETFINQVIEYTENINEGQNSDTELIEQEQ